MKRDQETREDDDLQHIPTVEELIVAIEEGA